MPTTPPRTRLMGAAIWLQSHAIVRYLLVGGSLFVLDTSVFLALVNGVGLPVWSAQLVARTVGAAAGFVGHRAYTFRRPGAVAAHSEAAQGVGYVALTLGNIALSPLVVEGMVWLMPSSLVLAKVAAEAVIVTESFLLLRVVFRQREPADA